MTDIKTLFKFKSQQPYYDKERYGIKNNTVRVIDLNDERFLDLIYWNRVGWNDGDIQIQITNVEQPNNSFTRDIRDISIYNNLMVITWNEKEVK